MPRVRQVINELHQQYEALVQAGKNPAEIKTILTAQHPLYKSVVVTDADFELLYSSTTGSSKSGSRTIITQADCEKDADIVKSGVVAKIANTLTIGPVKKICSLNNAYKAAELIQIISDTFMCIDSEFTAPHIYLPPRGHVTLHGCTFKGEVHYAGAEQ